MSHGTGSGYCVVSTAELNRRAVAGARLRCAALRARLELATGRPAAVSEPMHGSITAWERHEAALVAAIDAAVLRSLAAPPARPSGKQPQGEAERLDRLERVDGPDGPERVDRVAEVLARRESRAQDARARLVHRAERLADLYADVPDAAALRAALQQRADSRDLDEATLVRVEAELERLRVRAAAEADRRFVVEQTAAALRSLGYAVGEEFVPQALRGRAVVGAPEGPAYGLELDFHPQRPRLVTEVVAFTPANAHDRKAEEAACRNLELLTAELADTVALTREQTLAPGAAPVVRVAGAVPTGSAGSASEMTVRAR